MLKRILAVWLVCIALIGSMPAFSYEYPHRFWAPADKYAKARETQNHQDIVTYGLQVIDIMKGEPDSHSVRNTLVMAYDVVGKSYAALGEYDKSGALYREMYAYLKGFITGPDQEFYDYLVTSKARMNQYPTELKLYSEGGVSPYFGARNEHGNGVLYGVCADSLIRSDLENESMVLLYQEFGEDLIPYNRGVLEEASRKGLLVEYALNCPKEGYDIVNFDRKKAQLSSISELFSTYSDVPILLRFGAEFNAWSAPIDPERYKVVFQYVSDYFKRRNPNVAMVWSPIYSSSWSINYHDYYPGDEYVDWVGTSLYAKRYFEAGNDELEVVFETGRNSNPVLAIRDLVETYGDRKPIIISECGCSHKDDSRAEDTTNFAVRRLREYYQYLPMVYPQIKVMAYFDQYVSPEKDHFTLTDNAWMKSEFLRLTQGGRFIQNKGGGQTGLCYWEVVDGSAVPAVFDVQGYVHMYDETVEQVEYYIDGRFAAMSSELPFTAYLSTTDGTHTLRMVAKSRSGQTAEKEMRIYATAHREIDVLLDGKTVSFDQEPVIYHDRTMVPMRKIFELLGADVSWNSESRTAIGKMHGKRVEITVGSHTMRINGEEVALDAPAIILAGRTLVPVRAIAEGLDCDVDWDGGSATVYIYS